MRCRPILIGDTATRLAALLREKAGALGVALRALAIQPDRVYLAVDAPPTLSPHRIVCGLKAHSSGPLRREFKEVSAMPTLWTRDYVVAAGEGMTQEQALAAYEATLAPRRPRGRPPCAVRHG
jgi:putative transposase